MSSGGKGGRSRGESRGEGPALKKRVNEISCTPHLRHTHDPARMTFSAPSQMLHKKRVNDSEARNRKVQDFLDSLQVSFGGTTAK